MGRPTKAFFVTFAPCFAIASLCLFSVSVESFAHHGSCQRSLAHFKGPTGTSVKMIMVEGGCREQRMSSANHNGNTNSNRNSSNSSNHNVASSNSAVWRNRQPLRTRLCAVGNGNPRVDANERRQQSLEQGNNPLISLNLNLDSLAQQGAAPRAQEMLQRIRALHQEGYYDVSPDTVSYNTVLKAWKEDDNPDKAYELLQGMLDSHSAAQADVISFNTVMISYARQGDHRHCVQLLHQMEEKGGLLQPDVVTYNAVLYSYAQSRDKGMALKAEKLLRHMMDPLKSNVMVDTTSFNTVIYAWVQQVQGPNAGQAAQRAQDLLEHMVVINEAGNHGVQPDIYTYNSVIQGWAKCGKPYKARAIFERLRRDDPQIEPNRFTYTAIMSSLAKAGQPQRAQKILNDLMQAYEDGNVQMKPDTIAFSCVIDGWAKISGADNPGAADEAMKLLEQMKALEDDGMGPNSQTYTSVITALAKSGKWDACGTAHSLLIELEEQHADGRIELKPTNFHWNALLNAYARSPRADKALRAYHVLCEMKQHPRAECHPDIISYNSLLMACANAFGDEELKRKSYEIAVEAFRTTMRDGGNDHRSGGSKQTPRMNRTKRNDGKSRPRQPRARTLEPTSTTFAHFCKATRRLVRQPKQTQNLKEVFSLCSSRGLVNEIVLQQMKRSMLSDEDWMDILRGSNSGGRDGGAGDGGGGNERTPPRRPFATKGINDSLELSHLPREFICNARR